jgi:hypothetical protein
MLQNTGKRIIHNNKEHQRCPKINKEHITKEENNNNNNTPTTPINTKAVSQYNPTLKERRAEPAKKGNSKIKSADRSPNNPNYTPIHSSIKPHTRQVTLPTHMKSRD